jgi:alpha-beta hydrolase superfamily lysophospholipase
MKLVSIPANPVPDDVVTGAIQTPDGVNLRFARWPPPPGRKGTVLVCRGAPNLSRNISRRCATCARAVSQW